MAPVRLLLNPTVPGRLGPEPPLPLCGRYERSISSWKKKELLCLIINQAPVLAIIRAHVVSRVFIRRDDARSAQFPDKFKSISRRAY